MMSHHNHFSEGLRQRVRRLVLLTLFTAALGGVARGQDPTKLGRLRLVASDWELIRGAGGIQGSEVRWVKRANSTNAATLSITEAVPAEIYLVSRTALRGDFDVQVD